MNAWFFSILVIFGFVNFAFLLSRFLKRNDFMDVLWGLGFILVSVTAYLKTQFWTINKLILVVLIVFWGGSISISYFN